MECHILTTADEPLERLNWIWYSADLWRCIGVFAKTIAPDYNQIYYDQETHLRKRNIQSLAQLRWFTCTQFPFGSVGSANDPSFVKINELNLCHSTLSPVLPHFNAHSFRIQAAG